MINKFVRVCVCSFGGNDSRGANAVPVIVTVKLCNCSQTDRGQCVWRRLQEGFNNTDTFQIVECRPTFRNRSLMVWYSSTRYLRILSTKKYTTLCYHYVQPRRGCSKDRPRVDFCRVTLCIARPMPSCGVCLSVYLSVTYVYCIETSKYILKLFHRLIGPTLVFLYKTLSQYSDVDPLTGASNAEELWKIAIFDQYLALSRKWYEVGHSNLLWNAVNSYAIYQVMPFSMTLSNPNLDCKVMILFIVK